MNSIAARGDIEAVPRHGNHGTGASKSTRIDPSSVYA
jgi:hypothetical protein